MQGAGVDTETVDPCRFTVLRDVKRVNHGSTVIGPVLNPLIVRRIWLNRPPLALWMCPIDNILVHLGPEKSWVGVLLHETVDLSLDLIEAGRGGICQALLGPLPGAVVDVHLSGKRAGKTYYLYS